jgi:hypothetical protein
MGYRKRQQLPIFPKGLSISLPDFLGRESVLIYWCRASEFGGK